MKSSSLLLRGLGALVMVLAVVCAAHAQPGADVLQHVVPFLFVGSAAQVRYPMVPRNYEDLEAVSTPGSSYTAEFIPFCFFDTQSSGNTVLGNYNFFGGQATDLTLGNLPQAGTIPAGQYYQLAYIGFECLQPVTAASEVNVNNLITLYYVSRPVMVLTYATKLYGQWPLTHLNRPGGFSVQSSITTHSEAQWMSDGVGVWIDGAVTFQPRQSFQWQLQALAGGTITTAPLQMRASMYGTLYRTVR